MLSDYAKLGDTESGDAASKIAKEELLSLS
jgi:hypothetical protein